MGDRIFYYFFGAALIGTGLVLLAKGGLELPTRHPPKTIQFSGLSHFLFSLSPILTGWCLLRLGVDSSRRNQLMTKTLFFAGIFSMCAALVIAQKNM